MGPWVSLAILPGLGPGDPGSKLHSNEIPGGPIFNGGITLATKKLYGSVKRYGARYGRTSRQIAGGIEHKQRKAHKCPKCNKISAKRLSAGIWQCTKCNAKFTGKSYETAKSRNYVAVERKEEEIDTSVLEAKEKSKGERYKEA